MQKCKLCNANSYIREQVETCIAQGGSYKEGAQLAERMGLKISATSVQRHIENHTEVKKKSTDTGEEKESARTEVAPVNFEENAFDTTALLSTNKTWDDLNKFAPEQLKRIYQNLCLVVDQRLGDYMRKKGKYPDKEIKNLCDLTNLLNKHTPFNMMNQSDNESRNQQDSGVVIYIPNNNRDNPTDSQ